MEKKFSNMAELIDNLQRGGEVEFIYNQKYYSITHFGEGKEHKISVLEAYNYASEMILDISEVEKVGEYLLGDVKLKSVIANCEITFRCF